MDNNEQNFEMKENCTDEEINGIENEKAEPEKEAVKEMSSSTSAVESPLKEKAKKRANLSPNVLDEVLAWIKRTELAQSSLSTSSYKMNRYCWAYLHGWKVKPHIVEYLGFWRELKKENEQKIWIHYAGDEKAIIPIANVNPPEYIIGFEQFDFEYIDDRALQFMEKIIPLFKDVAIRFIDIDEDTMQNDSIARMIDLLAPKTSSLLANSKNKLNLSKFYKQYPGFIDGLKSFRLFISTEVMLDLTMELKWLITPRKDGQPKKLEIYTEVPISQIMKMDLLLENVKEEFVHSTELAKFIICIWNNSVHEEPIEIFEDFKIENEKTGEILELKRNNEQEYYLIRHKNDDELSTKIDDLQEHFDLGKTETIINIYADRKERQ